LHDPGGDQVGAGRTSTDALQQFLERSQLKFGRLAVSPAQRIDVEQRLGINDPACQHRVA
jgi:hypothetical protein